jgi:hypothetical protein
MIMSWICPNCGRSFRHPAQSHSCEIVSLEKHFNKRSPELKQLYDKLIKEISAFGPLQVNILRNAITIAGKSTFMAFKTRSEYAEIEILSDKEINEFPIYKTFRVSRSRVALFIRVQSPDEIDTQLISWLKHAYEMVAS